MRASEGAEALLDARANSRGNVYAGGINLWDRRKPRPNAAMPPPHATFDKQDGKPVLRVGSVSVAIPEDLPDQLRGNDLSADRVSALITPSRCYVAVYDDFGSPYRLACLERSSAKVRWVAKVWASFWCNVEGQALISWVEVTEQGNRVVVFGAPGGFYVEAFRADDGVNLLRFSNSYWGR